MTQPLKSAKEIFLMAVDIAPPERAALLNIECGEDRALRRQVEALLQVHDQPDSLLDSPRIEVGITPADGPAGCPTVDQPILETTGTQIGPYKLLQQIGEGGMGVVYMAEQTEPIERRVALKIIKPGMDTNQVIARFEAERQALAMMDHPNIARVLDAGRTQTGRPYFVMELVKGIPITKYCDQEHLSVKQRLELFIPICQAIQHAHQKGIIHRDIKPTNILVARFDGQPSPKVIDFGVAKATNQRLTDKTMFTQFGQIVGTIEYMSPEQAEFNQLDIDTRSDIYSLGVLLYELLTGETPFDKQRLRSAAFQEMLRIIREEEPSRPSIKVNSSLSLPSIAANRRAEPNRLGSTIRGELDWIVMKAMDKDRSRRFETANGLALDIQRYLSDETVLACPPSAAYRFRKFARRNKAALATVGLVTAALCIGLIATAWQARIAFAAKANETRQRIEAENQRAEAVKQKTIANEKAEAEAQARKRAEVIIEFVITALKSSDPTEAGKRDMTIAEAMQNAVNEIEAGVFKDDPEIEAGLQETIGVILQNNGRYKEAEPLLKQALETRERMWGPNDPSVVSNLRILGNNYWHLGQYSVAEPLLIRAVEITEARSGPNDQCLIVPLSSLANLRLKQGNYSVAESLCSRAIAITQEVFGPHDTRLLGLLSNQGYIYKQLGRIKDVQLTLTQSLEIAEQAYGKNHPQTALCLNNLAGYYHENGDPQKAIPLFERAISNWEAAYGADHPYIGTMLSNLAVDCTNQGDYDKARSLLERALTILNATFASDHPEIIVVEGNLASLYWRQNRLDQAIPLFERILAANEKNLGRTHPATLVIIGNLGVNYRDAGRLAEAIPLLEEVCQVTKNPGRLQFFRLQLLEAFVMGANANLPGDRERANQLAESMLASARETYPADSKELCQTLNDVGSKLWKLGELDKSVPLFEELLGIRERALGRDDASTLNAVANLGINYRDAGQIGKAIPLLEEAFRATKQHPELNWVSWELIRAYSEGPVSDPSGHRDMVLAMLQESLTQARASLPDDSPQLAGIIATASAALLRFESWDEAEPLLRECLEIRERIQPDNWATSNTRSMLGEALMGQKKFPEAEPLLLSGYQELSEREKTIPRQGQARPLEALERLVRFYQVTGQTDEADKWQAEFDKRQGNMKSIGSAPANSDPGKAEEDGKQE